MSKAKLMNPTSMSRIEELSIVQKQLGGEGSPGLLDYYGVPKLQHGQDLHSSLLTVRACYVEQLREYLDVDSNYYVLVKNKAFPNLFNL